MRNLKPTDQISTLIVDDTPLVVTMLSALLNGIGIQKITSAANVDTALEKFPRLGDSPFDVVFLDRYLGNESGIEILKVLRERYKRLPVIMLTQEDGGAKVIEAINFGATDYIVKPFTEDVVVKKLEFALGRSFKTS